MSRHSKRSIRIFGGAAGGATHTTRRSARRMVERDRARWIDEYSIEILATPRHDSQYIPHLDLTVIERIARNSEAWSIRDSLGLPNFCPLQIDRRPSRGRRV